MKLLDLTFEDPAANLALDEALLELLDADAAVPEVLRLWQPARPLVVLGRSSGIQREIDFPRCRQEAIPVLRRCSGGAAVVTGPGCLMYATTLRYADRPQLRGLDRAHRFVLGTVRRALADCGVVCEIRGTSDLAIGERKISGNSMRCKRNALLYHGTLLCRMNLPMLERYLRLPPRQPEYRAGRAHRDFVANLDLDPESLVAALARGWGVDGVLDDWPREQVQRLVAEKYSRAQWTQRH